MPTKFLFKYGSKAYKKTKSPMLQMNTGDYIKDKVGLKGFLLL
jgi:hypothetical protein